MPPRGLTNPAPKTESAREAVKAFFCELCQKGYSRSNEFEAHESSYDHQHRKRLKEMKQMQRDPGAAARARRAEQKDQERGGGLISIKPVKLEGVSKAAAAGAGGMGFKKAGFKSSFAGPGGGEKESEARKGFKKAFAGDEEKEEVVKTTVSSADPGAESDDPTDYEYYNPRRPTECGIDCLGRH